MKTPHLLAGGGIAALLATTVIAFTGPGGDHAAHAAPEPSHDHAAEGMATSPDAAVQLSPEQLRHFGVTFDTVGRRTLVDEVRTVGIVKFDETRIARVAPKFSGFVEKLYVDFTGQPVRRGEPVAEIYSPELVSAQEEMLLAARLDHSLGESAVPGVPAGSPDLLAAARRRLRLWDVSDAQIDQVLRSGKVRRTLTLYATASGVVTEKNVLRGQAVQAGDDLYTIADLSRVWIEAELREADAGEVREGSPAVVALNAFPGRTLAGRVEYVYPTLRDESRTMSARISVANPDGRIRPGMYARVTFATPSGSALSVPSSAIVDTGLRKMVFVDAGAGRVRAMEVETGRVAGEFTELLSGARPGQRVVTSAQFLLDSESNLGQAMSGMAGMQMPAGKE